MAIQFMPDWGKKGRSGFGWQIYLIVAMANRGIKVIKDFSVRLNQLALAHISEWQNVSGYFHRPASDIFMGTIEGREIYVNQYTPDPRVGLPEYITIGAAVNLAGDLKFLSYSSQGF